LHDVQAMVKGARHHLQPSSRLFVQRPEPCVVFEDCARGAHTTLAIRRMDPRG
jgi:hypothetical protein